jgi:hypothetical protein
VRGNAGEQGLCPVASKLPHGKRLGRGERVQPETRERQRMTRHAGRSEHRIFKARPPFDDPSDRPPVGFGVDAKTCRGPRHRSLHDDRLASVEGMCEHRSRLDPLEAMRGERKRAPEG